MHFFLTNYVLILNIIIEYNFTLTYYGHEFVPQYQVSKGNLSDIWNKQWLTLVNIWRKQYSIVRWMLIMIWQWCTCQPVLRNNQWLCGYGNPALSAERNFRSRSPYISALSERWRNIQAHIKLDGYDNWYMKWSLMMTLNIYNRLNSDPNSHIYLPLSSASCVSGNVIDQ